LFVSETSLPQSQFSSIIEACCVNDGDFEIVVVTLTRQRVEFANFARLAEKDY